MPEVELQQCSLGNTTYIELQKYFGNTTYISLVIIELQTPGMRRSARFSICRRGN